MYSLHIPQHGYRVWFRKNQEGSLWNVLPYSPRDNYQQAEDLVEYYEGEWGSMYQYTIHACGQRPSGMCVPYI